MRRSIPDASIFKASTVVLASLAAFEAVADWASAFPESVNASAALSEAWVALASSDVITCSESSSFLWPYPYPTNSQDTAIKKNTIPIAPMYVPSSYPLSNVQVRQKMQATTAVRFNLD